MKAMMEKIANANTDEMVAACNSAATIMAFKDFLKSIQQLTASGENETPEEYIDRLRSMTEMFQNMLERKGGGIMEQIRR